jgi:hypothetical protein
MGDQPSVTDTKKVGSGPKIPWSRDQEELLATWSDKAACYRWLHDKTEKRFTTYNAWFTIPVIILSTLSGTANFGLTSIFPPGLAGVAQLGIGGVTLLTGIISTIANFLRYAQGMESNRVAGIAWGKLQRKIAIELALSPIQRVDAMDFLKLCRAEMDRLIEQSPQIPEDIIEAFERTFKSVQGVSKPEICNELVHTHIYEGKDERLAQITAKAAVILRNDRKDKYNELLHNPEIQKDIQKELVRRRASIAPNANTAVIDELKAIQGAGVASRLRGLASAAKERTAAIRAEAAAAGGAGEPVVVVVPEVKKNVDDVPMTLSGAPIV